MSAKTAVAIVVVVAACLSLANPAAAHCDAWDGPVVRDARVALAKGDPAAALKWVAVADEAEIRDAFAKTLAVRNLGKGAQQLADQWFFETLVRVHRAGEGEGFTGLKPPGSVSAGIAAADAALESGAATKLAKDLSAAIEKNVQRRFELASDLRKHAGDDVQAGRKYVSAYVEYVHFVESVHGLAEGGTSNKHHDDH